MGGGFSSGHRWGILGGHPGKMRTIHFKYGEIACRICHNLSYTSCNENHKYDSLCKSMARDDSRLTWLDYRQALKRFTKKDEPSGVL